MVTRRRLCILCLSFALLGYVLGKNNKYNSDVGFIIDRWDEVKDGRRCTCSDRDLRARPWSPARRPEDSTGPLKTTSVVFQNHIRCLSTPHPLSFDRGGCCSDVDLTVTVSPHSAQGNVRAVFMDADGIKPEYGIFFENCVNSLSLSNFVCICILVPNV